MGRRRPDGALAFRAPTTRGLGCMINYLRLGLVTVTATVVALGAIAQVQAAEPVQDRIVSANPENFTPNVEDGKVESMVQVGNRIIAVGKFTKVTPTGGHHGHPQQHLRVQRDHRRHRHHLRPQRGHQGGLRGRRRRRRHRLHRWALQQRERRQVHARRSRGSTRPPVPWSRLSSRRIPTAGSPTCSWRTASCTSAAPSRRSAASRGRFSPRSTRRPERTPTRWQRRSPTRGTAAASASSTSTSATTARRWWRSATSRQSTGRAGPRSSCSTSPARPPSSATGRPQRYTSNCAAVFDTYLRDVDIAPSGDYMVVVATGAQSGGVGSGTLCDSASRWELGSVDGCRRARTRAGWTTAVATRSRRPRSPGPSSTSAGTSAG